MPRCGRKGAFLTGAEGRGWLTITADEPWDPKLGNFPSDLAVLVGHVVAVPPLISKW